MRNKILSTFLAAAVIGGFLLISQLMSDETDGQAMAAASINGDEVQRGGKVGRNQISEEISHDPQSLIGVNGAQMRGILNAPQLVRRESPTVIWQYRSETCVLDLYFQSAKKDVSLSPIKHFEIRARQKGVSDEAVQESCVPELIKAQNGFQMVGVNAFYKALTR